MQNNQSFNNVYCMISSSKSISCHTTHCPSAVTSPVGRVDCGGGSLCQRGRELASSEWNSWARERNRSEKPNQIREFSFVALLLTTRLVCDKVFCFFPSVCGSPVPVACSRWSEHQGKDNFQLSVKLVWSPGLDVCGVNYRLWLLCFLFTNVVMQTMTRQWVQTYNVAYPLFGTRPRRGQYPWTMLSVHQCRPSLSDSLGHCLCVHTPHGAVDRLYVRYYRLPVKYG